jgi:L-asparaginase / beta-aspartyl-peptidase
MMFKTLSLIVIATMTIAAAPRTKSTKPAAAKPRWALVIHGGAGVMDKATMPPEKEAAVRAALKLALDKGSIILRRGGTSVDAVEAAVKVLEDDPNFNAGKGSVFTYEGGISDRRGQPGPSRAPKLRATRSALLEK